MCDSERKLAEWIAEQTYSDLPENIRNRATLTIADSVGTIIGGITTDNVSSLVSIDARTECANVPVLGTERRTTTNKAAIIYGTAGTALELDEGHKYASGHPAMHVLPALLCEAVTNPGSQEAFLTAFVTAYEAVTRVARACTPLKNQYHMHGLWGTVGAAAGVAKYRGCDSDQILTAMQMAANHAQHTRFKAAVEGATIRNTYTGMSNLDALNVVNQTQAGFTALENGIERHLEGVAAEGFQSTTVAEDLGSTWEIMRGYFKIHAACRFTHPVLDALDEILESEDLGPAEITEVVVETYENASRLSDDRPENSLQAKFSIPFAVATRIHNGRSDKPAFDSEAIDDRTLSLARDTSVRSSAEFESRTPEARGARVTVRVAHDKEFVAEVPRPRGDPQRPLSEEELRQKFESLVSPVLTRESADKIWTGIREEVLSPKEIHSIGTKG